MFFTISCVCAVSLASSWGANAVADQFSAYIIYEGGGDLQLLLYPILSHWIRTGARLLPGTWEAGLRRLDGSSPYRATGPSRPAAARPADLQVQRKTGRPRANPRGTRCAGRGLGVLILWLGLVRLQPRFVPWARSAVASPKSLSSLNLRGRGPAGVWAGGRGDVLKPGHRQLALAARSIAGHRRDSPPIRVRRVNWAAPIIGRSPAYRRLRRGWRSLSIDRPSVPSALQASAGIWEPWSCDLHLSRLAEFNEVGDSRPLVVRLPPSIQLGAQAPRHRRRLRLRVRRLITISS